MTIKRIVVISDLQVPFHDKKAVKNVAQFIRKYKPDDVLCVGDETILDLEAMAITLIVRARDKEGKRLFSKAERMELMNEYDPEVITQIVSAMNSPVPSVEDAEKN